MEVLKGINMTINKGDIVVVIGPSGSGKSTFLRCLNCMEDPTSGKHHIRRRGYRRPASVDINIHRRQMGMVFQHFNLFNNKTVIENIMLAPVLCARRTDARQWCTICSTRISCPCTPSREIKERGGGERAQAACSA